MHVLQVGLFQSKLHAAEDTHGAKEAWTAYRSLLAQWVTQQETCAPGHEGEAANEQGRPGHWSDEPPAQSQGRRHDSPPRSPAVAAQGDEGRSTPGQRVHKVGLVLDVAAVEGRLNTATEQLW